MVRYYHKAGAKSTENLSDKQVSMKNEFCVKDMICAPAQQPLRGFGLDIVRLTGDNEGTAKDGDTEGRDSPG